MGVPTRTGAGAETGVPAATGDEAETETWGAAESGVVPVVTAAGDGAESDGVPAVITGDDD